MTLLHEILRGTRISQQTDTGSLRPIQGSVSNELAPQQRHGDADSDCLVIVLAGIVVEPHSTGRRLPQTNSGELRNQLLVGFGIQISRLRKARCNAFATRPTHCAENTNSDARMPRDRRRWRRETVWNGSA